MEKIYKLKYEDHKVKLTDELNSCLKNLFSGCRISFLIGAGFSANLLCVLNNDEIIFEGLQQYRRIDEKTESKIQILLAYLYWKFFSECIYPIANNVNVDSMKLEAYYSFAKIIYRILSERGNPVLDRQCNIFTTNYDPILELAFDHSKCICNDGFEGRICPVFATDNYAKSYYRGAIYSNRKAEIPSINLVKLHGSVTWGRDKGGGIEYKDYGLVLSLFYNKYVRWFDDEILHAIKNHFIAKNEAEVKIQIEDFLGNAIFDGLLSNSIDYNQMLDDYKATFLIVNPTKEKFKDTLLNKNYYELLRIFSNELEKENSLLVVDGFSFKDEHILDLTKRSMLNPSLKVVIFCYEEKSIDDYQRLFKNAKLNNISYICLEGDKLSIEEMNQILLYIDS